MTGRRDSITNCYRFSSPSAAFPSSTSHPPFYFTSGCRCDGKESAAGEFWSAPNNGSIYLTSPPPRLSPAKNNQRFSLSWEFSLKTVGSVFYFLLQTNAFSFFRWQNSFLLPCATTGHRKLTKSHGLLWVRQWSALRSSASL